MLGVSYTNMFMEQNLKSAKPARSTACRAELLIDLGPVGQKKKKRSYKAASCSIAMPLHF